MKVQGNGQAKVLDSDELSRLFRDGLQHPHHRLLFAICLYTGCRISEALNLRMTDVSDEAITFRKANTKGKSSRTVGISPELKPYFDAIERVTWNEREFVIPGKFGHLSRATADRVLRSACEKVGLVGVSTHSFRRTALTMMSNKGIPLRVIQKISGHKSLAVLQQYLEVSDEQTDEALMTITF